jgi:ESCO1/2 acetyl-transferase
VSITDITIPLTDLLSPTSCTSNFSDETSEILLKGNDRIEGRVRIEGTEDNFESVSWSAGIKRERDKDDDRPSKATLGVRQIWVHSGFRRKSLASSLVDAARKSFIFGSVVMRSHTAYSQPTTDGLNFALSYSQKSTIWSYK